MQLMHHPANRFFLGVNVPKKGNMFSIKKEVPLSKVRNEMKKHGVLQFGWTTSQFDWF